MSKPTHNEILKWRYKNNLIDNRDFRRGFIEVNLASFADTAYTAGFEAGKKSCADLIKGFVDGICDSEKGGAA